MTESPVFEAIVDERVYQDNKFGTTIDDTTNTPWMWASYVNNYSTKWMNGEFAPLDSATVDAFRQSMIKTAALAVAAVESVDRQRAAAGKAFFEA